MGWFDIPHVKYGGCDEFLFYQVRKNTEDISSLNGTVKELRRDVDNLIIGNNNIRESLERESEERREADSALNDRIDAIERGGDISELRQAIHTERNERIAADNVLRESIAYVETQIETSARDAQRAREDAETALTVATEILGTQVPRLESLIESERSERMIAVERLRTEFGGRITEVESNVSDLTGRVADAEEAAAAAQETASNAAESARAAQDAVSGLSQRLTTDESNIESNTSRIEVLEQRPSGGTSLQRRNYQTNLTRTGSTNTYTGQITVPYEVWRKVSFFNITVRYTVSPSSTANIRLLVSDVGGLYVFDNGDTVLAPGSSSDGVRFWQNASSDGNVNIAIELPSATIGSPVAYLNLVELE